MILGSILGLCAAAQLIIGLLAWTGKLPGNSYIGLKIPQVRKSQELWTLAHKVAGPLWTVAGVALAFAALLAFKASGAMYLVIILLILAAIVCAGIGGAIAAQTVVTVDNQQQAEQEAADGCCGGTAAPETEDPAAACGVPGGCGSCELKDDCTDGPKIDLAALRKAAVAADQPQQ